MLLLDGMVCEIRNCCFNFCSLSETNLGTKILTEGMVLSNLDTPDNRLAGLVYMYYEAEGL